MSAQPAASAHMAAYHGRYMIWPACHQVSGSSRSVPVAEDLSEAESKLSFLVASGEALHFRDYGRVRGLPAQVVLGLLTDWTSYRVGDLGQRGARQLSPVAELVHSARGSEHSALHMRAGAALCTRATARCSAARLYGVSSPHAPRCAGGDTHPGHVRRFPQLACIR